MAKQTINLGTSPNDRTGTNLRAAFDICNDNFSELYDVCSVDGTVKVKYVYWNNSFSDTPLTSEIEEALGITAANANTGCIFLVLDNVTIYQFTSSGTNWYYLKYTEAN